MPIQVTCSCGTVLKVPSELAGKTVRCKACGSAQKVPSPKQKRKAAKPDDEFSALLGLSEDELAGGQAVADGDPAASPASAGRRAKKKRKRAPAAFRITRRHVWIATFGVWLLFTGIGALSKSLMNLILPAMWWAGGLMMVGGGLMLLLRTLGWVGRNPGKALLVGLGAATGGGAAAGYAVGKTGALDGVIDYDADTGLGGQILIAGLVVLVLSVITMFVQVKAHGWDEPPQQPPQQRRVELRGA